MKIKHYPMDDSFIVGPTGRQISLLEPEFDKATSLELLTEVGTGLAQTLRFAGHTRPQYTVAQHSVLLTVLYPGLNAQGKLMHDASEAYLGDIPKPLKALLPDYRRIEGYFQGNIERALGLKDPHVGVAEADNMAAMCEMEILGFGVGTYYGRQVQIPQLYLSRAKEFLFRVWSREEARNRWLDAVLHERASRHPETGAPK